uniref:Cytochrome c oxidase subunit 3 n=1 Tax=Parabreviscolex niepini TaxID=2041585 RepID=A0A3G2QVI5_9CEST|nr:cytochrome c oxidase subunit III [Parabreviscolex niepini]AYO27334.1 cytochrome c oxidase subunit 3 [Parabreviscolex niepini]
MSVVALVSSWFIPVLIAGLFFWDTGVLLFSAAMVGLVVVVISSDVFHGVAHYHWAFLLFLVTEGCLFLSFLNSGSWFYSGDWVSVSDSLEIPLVACFLLLGSSISITGFHHVYSWGYSSVLLWLTAFLGCCFVLLQIIEFSEAVSNLISNGFYSACLSTVGLHFFHVWVGVLAMIAVLWSGAARTGFYFCSTLTWYWHFVDYVWLLVYAFIYVC